MAQRVKRREPTLYLDPDLLEAMRLLAAVTHRSGS
jgi:hypothetical protein